MNGDIFKNFPPLVFNAPFRGFAWNFAMAVGLQKTRMMPEKKSTFVTCK